MNEIILSLPSEKNNQYIRKNYEYDNDKMNIFLSTINIQELKNIFNSFVEEKEIDLGKLYNIIENEEKKSDKNYIENTGNTLTNFLNILVLKKSTIVIPTIPTDEEKMNPTKETQKTGQENTIISKRTSYNKKILDFYNIGDNYTKTQTELHRY